MIFLNPIGLSLLGLAPLIVLLYLRRIRRRELPASTLLFWQRALGEQRRTAFFGRLRQWLSLVLHLVILLLLALALARPEFTGLSLTGDSTLIVLDTRARMQATEADGATRFEKARTAAKVIAARARDGAGVGIIAIGRRPQVVAGLSGDPGSLLPALDALAATDTGGDVAEALALAEQLLLSRPGGRRIVVLSDGQELPAVAQESGIRLENVSLATPRDNVAITRFAARPELVSPQTAALLLEIAYFGEGEAEGNVEITLDGRLIDVRPFKLGPGERKADLFPSLPGSERGELTARLVPSPQTTDALALDNTAYAILPTPKPIRVLLVTEENWFLEKLLAADRSLRFELLTPDAFQPEMARAFDVVIYDRVAPPPIGSLEGNALLIAANPLLENRGELTSPPVTDTLPESPLLRLVEWPQPTVFTAIRWMDGGGEEPRLAQLREEGWKVTMPIRSFEHPLVLTAERTGQRLVAFAFDFSKSDLPLRVAFPLLISNTLGWLAAPEPLPPATFAAGSTITLRPGEGVTPPEGVSLPPLNPSRPVLQPVRNGFYRVDEAEGRSPRWLAVNTWDEAEANLRLARPGGSGGDAPLPIAGAASFLVQPLWRWLVLAAFVLLLFEWWFFHRRRTE
ncbi:MAG TPA: VWA domain-containing protein [Chthoniobacteraceae bacterium]|nr:VWA domain-containing protein [Chthoniobacteraceae bacterium]